MQQIITITTQSDQGVETKNTMLKPAGKPVQVSVPPGSKIFVTIEGQGDVSHRTPKASKASQADLKLKQVGNNLLIKDGEEVLVEVTDFYTTQGASFGEVSWNYASESSATDHAAVGISGTGASSDSEAAGMLPLVSSSILGGIAFMGVALSTLGSSSAAVVSTETVVSGLITAGNVIAGHGLKVNFYNKAGVLLDTTPTDVDATGHFSKNLKVGAGEVIIAKVVDSTTGNDYTDEATNASKNLNATLLSVGISNGGAMTLNINPLTTIAAQKAGLAADGSGTVADTAAVTNAVDAVEHSFGVKAITTTAPDVTNDGTFDGTTASGKIGAILASLSGLDLVNERNGGSAQTTINDLKIAISGTNATAVLSATAQANLLAGAILASGNTAGGASALISAVSDTLAAVYGSTSLTVADIASDNVVDASEVASLTLTGTVATGTTRVSLDLNGQATVDANVSGTTWTYALSTADLAALGSDGAKYITATATLANATTTKATRTFSLNQTDDSPTAVVLQNTAFTTLAENTDTTAHRKVADISVIDDGQGTNVLSLTGADAASFEIVHDATTGKDALYLKAGVVLNYEAKTHYDVNVVASGGATPASVSTSYAFDLTDVNEVPTTIGTIPNPTFQVGGAVDSFTTPVLRTSVFNDVDAGVNGQLSYTATLSDGSALPTWLTYTVNSDGTLTFSGNPTSGGVLAVRVTATDGGGLSTHQDFNITLSSEPIINGVTFNRTTGFLKIGDTLDMTISADQADYTNGGITINGKAVTGFTNNHNNTYTVTYTVAAGDTDILDASQIPVSVVLTNSANSSNVAYTTAPAAASAPGIDANVPTISGVAVADGAWKVGSNVAVTLTAGGNETGLTLKSGATFNGQAVTGFIDHNDGTYTVTYTVQSGDTDRANNSAVPANLILVDTHGNESAASTSITLSGESIDAHIPIISSVTVANGTWIVGNTVALTINAGESGLTLRSGSTFNGRAVTGFTDNQNGTYTATYTVVEGDADHLDGDTVPANLVLTDANGNSSVATTNVVLSGESIDANSPTLSIDNIISANHIVNIADKTAGVTISGTTTAENTQSVTVVWGGHSQTATVLNGVWLTTFLSANVPATGSTTVTASVSDASGNAAAQASKTVTVDVTAPTVGINTLTGGAGVSGDIDNVLNRAELDQIDTANTWTITGTTTAEVGQPVSLTLNSATYSGSVTSSGVWSVVLAKTVVDALVHGSDYTIAVNVSDVNGNPATPATQSLAVRIALPDVPTIQALNTNTYTPTLSGLAQKESATTPGTYIALDTGDEFSVSVGGQTYSLTLGSIGSNPLSYTASTKTWSLATPASVLTVDGVYNVGVSVNAVGYSTPKTDVSTGELVVKASLPTVVISSITGDNIINVAEHNASILVSGSVSDPHPVNSSTNTAVGGTVSFTFNSHTYTATVQSDGTWSTSIPALDAQSLTTGSQTLAASFTGIYGSTGTASQAVTIDVSAPTISSVSLADGAWSVGEAVTLTLTAGSNETGLSLKTGSTFNGRTVTGFHDNGDGTYNVTYTVGAGDNSRADGASAPASLILIDSHGNESAATTAVTLSGEYIDTIAPTLHATTVPATATTTVLGTPGNSAGETIALTVTFDGNVEGLTSGTNSSIFTVGGTGVSATWSGTAGTATRILTYTIAAVDNGQAAIDEGALKTALVAGIADAAGNVFTYSGSITNIDSTALPVIDTTAPVFGSGSTAVVAVGASTSSTVYDANATDSGGANDAGITYTLSGTNAGLFNISAAGVVTYKASPTATATQNINVIATDAAGNATTQAVSIDVTNSPTVTITDNMLGTLRAGDTVMFTFTFSEAMTGFDINDVTVAGGSKGAFVAVDATHYTLVVTPNANTNAGNITVDVAAGVAINSNSISNVAAMQGIQAYDTLAPSVALANTAAGAVVNLTESTNAVGVTSVTAESGAAWTVTFTGTSGTVTKSGTGTGAAQAVALLAADITTLGQGAVTTSVTATDTSGNPATASTNGDFSLDTLAPTLHATIVPVTATTTAAGTTGNSPTETITLTVTFDGNVNGLTSGTDNTIFTVGGTGVSAAWSGTAGTSTRTLTYTIAASGQNGQAAIVESALKTALTNGIFDAAGNPFTYTGAIANIDTTALPVIDTTAPTSPILAFTTGTGSGLGGKYVYNDIIEVVATFNEAMAVNAVSGSEPYINLNINGTTKQAKFYQVDPLDATKLKFHYTVEASLTDANGVAITANALTIPAGGSTIQDTAGNTAIITHALVADNTSVIVDSLAPGISTMAIATTPALASTYKAGDNIDFTVTTSAAVNVDATNGTPRLKLADFGDGISRYATYVSGTSTSSLTFRYIVTAGVTDSDGIALQDNALDFNGGSIRSVSSGNPVLVSSTALDTTQASHKVDGVASLINKIERVTTSVVNGTYQTDDYINIAEKAGTVTFKVTFDGTVKESTVAANQFQVTDGTGTAISGATYVSATLQGSAGSNVYNVVVGGLSGVVDASQLRLNVKANSNITDNAGNSVALMDYSVADAVNKQVYTVDALSGTINAGGIVTGSSSVVDGAFQTDTWLSKNELQVSAPIISANTTALLPGASTVIKITLPVSVGTGTFDVTDLVYAGGTVTGFAATSDPQVYTLTFTRNAVGSGTGEVAPSLLVKAGAFTDANGNPSAPAAWSPTATDFNGLAYPTVSFTSANWNTSTATVYFVFSAAISGFDASDVTVTGGSIGAISLYSGNTYQATFTRATTGAAALEAPSVSVLPGSYVNVNSNAGIGNTYFFDYGNQTVSFDVTFAEGVKGVTGSNFGLRNASGGAITGAVPALVATATNTDVNGLATQWHVVASGLAGLSSTGLRLDLINSTGILDHVGNTTSGYAFGADTSYNVNTTTTPSSTYTNNAYVTSSTTYYGQALSAKVYFTNKVLLATGKTVQITATISGVDYALTATGDATSALGVDYLTFTANTLLPNGLQANSVTFKANSLALGSGTNVADFRDIAGATAVTSFAQFAVGGLKVNTQSPSWTEFEPLSLDATLSTASGYYSSVINWFGTSDNTASGTPTAKYALLTTTNKLAPTDTDASLRDAYRINLSTGKYELASVANFTGAASTASDLYQAADSLTASSTGRWVAMGVQGARNALLDTDYATVNGQASWTSPSAASGVGIYARGLTPGASVQLWNGTTSISSAATVDANGYVALAATSFTAGSTTTIEIRDATNTGAGKISSAQFILSQSASYVDSLVLKDMDTGAVRIVATALDAAGLRTSTNSGSARVSSDASVVVFTSAGVKFVSGTAGRSDTQDFATVGSENNGAGSDVFVGVWNSGTSKYDLSRLTNLSTAVSLQDVTADGRYVLAQGVVGVNGSGALVASGSVNQIVLYDRTSGKWSLVSANTSGLAANNYSTDARFSPDGDQIIFTSMGTDLVANDTNAALDVFVRNLTSNGALAPSLSSAVRVSLDTNDVQLGGVNGSISTDGNTVSFNYNGVTYVRNISAKESLTVSAFSDGTVASGSYSALSPDGKSVLITTSSKINPVADTNGLTDLYTRRLSMLDLDTSSDTAATAGVFDPSAYDNLTSAADITLTASYLLAGKSVKLQQKTNTNSSYTDVSGTTVTVGADGKAHFTVSGFYDNTGVITQRTYQVVDATTGVAFTGNVIQNELTVYRDPTPAPAAPSSLMMASTSDAGTQGGYYGNDATVSNGSALDFIVAYKAGQNIVGLTLYKDINSDGVYTAGTDTVLATDAVTKTSGSSVLSHTFTGVNLGTSTSTATVGVFATNDIGSANSISSPVTTVNVVNGRALGTFVSASRTAASYFNAATSSATAQSGYDTRSLVFTPATVGGAPVITNSDTVSHTIKLSMVYQDANNNNKFDAGEALYYNNTGGAATLAVGSNAMVNGGFVSGTGTYNNYFAGAVILPMPVSQNISNIRYTYEVDGVTYQPGQKIDWTATSKSFALSAATAVVDTATSTTLAKLTMPTISAGVLGVDSTYQLEGALPQLSSPVGMMSSGGQDWELYITGTQLYRQSLSTGETQYLSAPTDVNAQALMNQSVRSVAPSANGQYVAFEVFQIASQPATTSSKYAASAKDANADGNLDNAYSNNTIVLRDVSKAATAADAFVYVARLAGDNTAQPLYDLKVSSDASTVIFQTGYDFSNALYTPLSNSYYTAATTDTNTGTGTANRVDAFVAIKRTDTGATDYDAANPYKIYRLSNGTGVSGPGGLVLDVSADGRYVAFATDKAEVGADTNGLYDVYIADTQNITAAPVLVSKYNSAAGNYASGTGGGRFYTQGGVTKFMFWTQAQLQADDPFITGFTTSSQLGDLYSVSMTTGTWGGPVRQVANAPITNFAASTGIPAATTLFDSASINSVADRKNLIRQNSWDISADGSRMAYYVYGGRNSQNGYAGSTFLEDTASGQVVGFDGSSSSYVQDIGTSTGTLLSTRPDYSYVYGGNAGPYLRSAGLALNNYVMGQASANGYRTLNLLSLATAGDTGASSGVQDVTAHDGRTTQLEGLVVNATGLAGGDTAVLTRLVGTDRVLVSTATVSSEGLASFTGINLGRSGQGGTLILQPTQVTHATITAATNTPVVGTPDVLTITFDTAPTGGSFTVGDLGAVGGSLSAFTVTADPKVYTVNFNRTQAASATVPVGVFLSANVLTSDGSTSLPATWNATDANAPTPTITVNTGSVSNGASMAVGDVATLKIAFSQAINVASFSVSDFYVVGGVARNLRAGAGANEYLVDFERINSNSAPSLMLSTGAVTSPSNVSASSAAWSGGKTTWDVLSIADTTGGALTYGATHTLSFSFANAPTGFDASDLSVTGGYISNFTATADTKVYTADFTRNRVEAAPSVQVAARTYNDAKGNPGNGAYWTPALDAETPAVVITAGNTAVASGQATPVTFTFTVPSDWTPTGFTSSDVVTLGGTLSGLSTLTKVNATTWTATATFTRENADSTASITVTPGSFQAVQAGVSTVYQVTDVAGNLYTSNVLANSLTLTYEDRPQMPWSLDLADASDNGAINNDNVLALSSPTATSLTGLTLSGQVGVGQGVDQVKLYLDKNNNGALDAGETVLTTLTSANGLNTSTGAFTATGVTLNVADGIANVATTYGNTTQFRVRAEAANTVSGKTSSEWKDATAQLALNLFLDSDPNASGLTTASWQSASLSTPGALVSASATTANTAGGGNAPTFVGKEWVYYTTGQAFTTSVNTTSGGVTTTAGVTDANAVNDVYRMNVNTGQYQLVTSVGTTQMTGTSPTAVVLDGVADGAHDQVLMLVSGVGNSLVTNATTGAVAKPYADADLVLKDMSTGNVSVIAKGVQYVGIANAQMSDDGSVIVYCAVSPQGIAGETGTYNAYQIFAKFRNTDGSYSQAVRVTTTTASGTDTKVIDSLSGDGKTLVFTTGTKELAADTDAVSDIYTLNLNTVRDAAFGAGATDFTATPTQPSNAAKTAAMSLVTSDGNGAEFVFGTQTPSSDQYGSVFDRSVTVNGVTTTYREVLFRSVADGADTAAGKTVTGVNSTYNNYFVRTLTATVNGVETTLSGAAQNLVQLDSQGATSGVVRRLDDMVTGSGVNYYSYFYESKIDNIADGKATFYTNWGGYTGRYLLDLATGKVLSVSNGANTPGVVTGVSQSASPGEPSVVSLSADGQWVAYTVNNAASSAAFNTNAIAGNTAVTDTNAVDDVVLRRTNMLWLGSDTGDSTNAADPTTWDGKTSQTNNVMINAVRVDSAAMNNPGQVTLTTGVAVLYELTLDGNGNITAQTALATATGTAGTGAASFTLATVSSGSHVYAVGDAAGNLYNDGVLQNRLTILVDPASVRATQPSALDLAAWQDDGTSSSDNITSAYQNLNINGKVGAGQGVAQVRVFDDRNNDGIYDAGSDVLLNTVTLAAADALKGTFATTVTLDNNAGAGVTRHIRAQAQSTGGSSWSLASAALDIQLVNPSTITQAPSGVALATASDSGLSSDLITRNTTGLTISGTANGTGNVTLFADINKNGVYDAGTDTLLLTPASASGAFSFTTTATLATGTYDIYAYQGSGATQSASSTPISLTIKSTADAATLPVVTASGSEMMLLSANAAGTTGAGGATGAWVVGNQTMGTKVYVQTTAALAAGDINTAQDIYVNDLAAGTRTLLDTSSVNSLARVTNSNVTFGDASADGAYVAFSGQYGPSSLYSIGVRSGGSTQVVASGLNANFVGNVRMNDAGDTLAFTTAASNVTGPLDNSNTGADLFVASRSGSAWTTTRLDVMDKNSAALTSSDIKLWDISANSTGTKYALISTSAQLTSGDTNSLDDLYRINLSTGAANLVSFADGGAAVGFSNTGGVDSPMLYAAGTKALWQSYFTAPLSYGGFTAAYSTHLISTDLGASTVKVMDTNAAGTDFFYAAGSHIGSISEDGVYVSYLGTSDYVVRNTSTHELVNMSGRQGDVPYSFTNSTANIFAPMISSDGKTLVGMTDRPYDTALDTVASTTDVYAKRLTLLDLLSDTGTGGAGDISYRDNSTSINTNLLFRANNLVAGNQVLLMEGSTVVSGATPVTVGSNGFADFTVASATSGVHTYAVTDIAGNPYTSGLFDNALKVTVI